MHLFRGFQKADLWIGGVEACPDSAGNNDLLVGKILPYFLYILLRLAAQEMCHQVEIQMGDLLLTAIVAQVLQADIFPEVDSVETVLLHQVAHIQEGYLVKLAAGRVEQDLPFFGM